MTIPHQPGPSASASLKKKRSWKFMLFLVLFIPLVAVALYTFFVLSWSYSDGIRAGELLKFSRKGWLCKTYEGELAQFLENQGQGMAPRIWAFTVRDEAVIQQLNQSVGQNVQLHYTEHKGVPTTCFGETQFYVDEVTLTKAPGTAAAPVPAPVPQSAAPAETAPATPPPATGQPTP